MPEPQVKTALTSTRIAAIVADKINTLTNAKKTGRYELTVEVQVSNGGIATAYLSSKYREQLIGDR